jgi:carbon monoxide dehydrogenase subunit G
MDDISTFESRTGKVNCKAEDLYHFLTDIRNFERFIPKDMFSDISMARDSCSFSVSMLGKVNIRIGERKEFSEVVFSGNAMQVNDFSLAVKFGSAEPSHSEVKLSVLANLNPFLKMLAAEPINKFLETIIAEMEKFSGWKEIRRDS